MTEITDAHIREMLPKTREYCALILKAGPNRHMPGVEQIIWEHGRRNVALRADGSDVGGVAIFNATADEVRAIMDEDPAVQAGVFVYHLHACRSLPGYSEEQMY